MIARDSGELPFQLCVNGKSLKSIFQTVRAPYEVTENGSGYEVKVLGRL